MQSHWDGPSHDEGRECRRNGEGFLVSVMDIYSRTSIGPITIRFKIIFLVKLFENDPKLYRGIYGIRL